MDIAVFFSRDFSFQPIDQHEVRKYRAGSHAVVTAKNTELPPGAFISPRGAELAHAAGCVIPLDGPRAESGRPSRDSIPAQPLYASQAVPVSQAPTPAASVPPRARGKQK